MTAWRDRVSFQGWAVRTQCVVKVSPETNHDLAMPHGITNRRSEKKGLGGGEVFGVSNHDSCKVNLARFENRIICNCIGKSINHAGSLIMFGSQLQYHHSSAN